MPKRCEPCLPSLLRDALLEAIEDSSLRREVSALPECKAGKAGKRAPSAYNLFIKECLASKNLKGKGFGAAAPFMKECAAEYKRKKGG
ncbi:MAG: hypothetical protein ABIH46_13045 [Chloroflexota bacterium]